MDELLTEMRQALWDTDRAQVVIAADLGISQKHLSMIRQGHADPSLDLFRRLCSVLDLRPGAARGAGPRQRQETGMSAKTYPIGVALSVASGKLLCDFPDMHEAITDLAGWPVMTHHMASEKLCDGAAAKVLAQVPWMAHVIENMPDWSAFDDARVAITNWLAFVAETVGDTVTVDLGEPLPYMGPFDGLERLGGAR